MTDVTRKKTIEEVDVTGKRVLMRVDFNVPLDTDGSITDDRRIRLALPSIRSVLDRGGRLVLMSHLGRPDGTGPEPKLSLRRVAGRLEELLQGVTIHFPGDACLGDASRAAAQSMQDGQTLLLENLRFSKAEKAGDGAFAESLAAYGDIYCNDAFGTAHRTDASVVGVAKCMADRPRVAGLLLAKEIRFLAGTLANPEHPFVALVGGAKVSDKLGALNNLMNTVDTILVGGAMAYTLLKANGLEMGSSLVQNELLAKAAQIIDHAAASATDLILPRDHVCGKELTSKTPVRVVSGAIPDGWIGLDIGPETSAQFDSILGEARTIVWNGPVGAFETAPFDVGTRLVAESIARATGHGATTVVGGGDSAAAVESFGLAPKYSHVSTGGGASLAVLEGQTLESVELLENAPS